MKKISSSAASLALIVVLGGGCPREQAPSGRVIDEKGVHPDSPAANASAPVLASFEDRFSLIGLESPTSVRPGEAIYVTARFRVEEEHVPSTRLKVFVHGLVPGGELPQLQADHPLPLRALEGPLRRGDIIVDRFRVKVPADYPADGVRLVGGLYEGKDRWKVKEGTHDGKDRVPLAEVAVEGGPPAFPTVVAKKRTAPVVVDGVLDEPDWQSAARIGPFISYRGPRTKIRGTTYARLLWDETSLYVAFECADTDVHTPYEKRDDPIYESEAVEIFIDADGDRDEYVELQAAPNDVHFDAAFKGGRRKNFDTSYDVDYETKTVIDGTFGNGEDVDVGWVSEWRIPIAGLRDIPAPVGPGTEWKINLFRLDRMRKAGKVVGSEASAWSSPYSGDFHNLDRFGTLRFE